MMCILEGTWVVRPAAFVHLGNVLASADLGPGVAVE